MYTLAYIFLVASICQNYYKFYVSKLRNLIALVNQFAKNNILIFFENLIFKCFQ